MDRHFAGILMELAGIVMGLLVMDVRVFRRQCACDTIVASTLGSYDSAFL